MVTCVIRTGAARRSAAEAPHRRPLRRSLGTPIFFAALAIACCAPAFFLVSAAPTVAAEPSGKPTTGRNSREDAVRLIPLDKLTPEIRRKVSAVIADVSIYRQLPTESVDCEPDLFRFLITNPDVLVNIWRVMGVSSVTLDRVDADQFHCSDGDGTTAQVQVVYRSPQMQVIYADGLYDGPLFPRPVRGQCVAILQYTNSRKPSGRFEETARLDTYLHVDNVGVELLARIFQGLVGRTIDHNFAETVAFVGNVSRTAETNPRGMHRLAAKLDHVEPERRNQFIAVTDRVAMKLADVKLTSDDDLNPTLAEAVQPSHSETPPRTSRK
ncbi:MAG TPA: hypothetical protein VGJ04_05415 [Pirellulales bacterium]|jgi:hypothetical protein